MNFAEHAALGLQHLFDTMVNHLRKQQARAVNENGNCRYRGTNGSMCAVGCLIAEEEYELDLETLSLENTIHFLMDGKAQPSRLKPLLWHMRQLHDDTTDVTEWEQGFKDVAEYFDLEYEEPHAEEGDPSFIPEEELETYTEISAQVLDMFKVALANY